MGLYISDFQPLLHYSTLTRLKLSVKIIGTPFLFWHCQGTPGSGGELTFPNGPIKKWPFPKLLWHICGPLTAHPCTSKITALHETHHSTTEGNTLSESFRMWHCQQVLDKVSASGKGPPASAPTTCHWRVAINTSGKKVSRMIPPYSVAAVACLRLLQHLHSAQKRISRHKPVVFQINCPPTHDLCAQHYLRRVGKQTVCFLKSPILCKSIQKSL